MADPNTMYHHQAMMGPDAKDFKEAMAKEISNQMENRNFIVHKKVNIPKGKTILPTIWQMRGKRDIKTGKIKKWKARLNIDGSRMQKTFIMIKHMHQLHHGNQ